MGRTACTEPQCLCKGAIYLYLYLYLFLYHLRFDIHIPSRCKRDLHSSAMLINLIGKVVTDVSGQFVQILDGLTPRR